MKIVENNVKCGGTIILDHKFYFKKTTKLLSNFGPAVRILSKKFVPGVGFLNKKFSDPEVSQEGDGYRSR